MRNATSKESRPQKRKGDKDLGHFPVVIIGAGVNGAGTFRDLSLQGVDCLLIDKGDFCSGTSAAPSRLIHGGLKYLETGEFRLVKESTLERNLLLRNAPHVVHPLRVGIPIFSWLGGIWSALKRMAGLQVRSNKRGALAIKAGLQLYDWYGRRSRVLPPHEMMTQSQSLHELPNLSSEVKATGWYYDAYVSQAERLGYELIEDGLNANEGSHALNYAELLDHEFGKLLVEDQVSGDTLQLEPEVLVNAAGPWIDFVNDRAGHETNYIGGTKGSHLLLQNPTLHEELDGRMVYYGTSDGRICLAYPFMGNILVGSTDIPVDNPDSVRADDEEITYMLKELQQLFPSIEVSREQVVYRYVGVRPLPESDADEPGEVSRDHSLIHDPPNEDRSYPIFSLVGGKWTTFRAFAREVSEEVLNVVGQSRTEGTKDLPIGGGKGYPKDDGDRRQWVNQVSEANGFSAGFVGSLLDRYGTTARAIAEYISEQGRCPLDSLDQYDRGELRYILENENVVHLSDLLMRRTPIALGGHLSRAVIEETSKIAAETLEWSDARRNSEVDSLVKTARLDHGVSL